MEKSQSSAHEYTSLPLEGSIASTASKLKADQSVTTLLKISNSAGSPGGTSTGRPKSSPKGTAPVDARPSVKFTSADGTAQTPHTMGVTGAGMTMLNTSEAVPPETMVVTQAASPGKGHCRDQQGGLGRPGTTQRKRAAIALASEKFSFVEEGRNVRLGRKPTVNCWTVITVNGKEFVVEKELKEGNALKSSGHVNEGRESRPRNDFNPTRQSAGKVRCDLCLLYFPKDSVNGVISFKRILDLRRKWGLELRGRRCNAASYIYSEARLCLFCSQLLHVSQRDTCDASRQKPPVDSTEHIQFTDGEGGKAPGKGGQEGGRGEKGKLGGTMRLDSSMERDVARGKPVVTSSVADACPGAMATNGLWKVGPNGEECCKTFHEYDPWLEVDLLALYHLKSVRILNRIERRGNPRVYRMTPFWVILSRTPILAQDLHEARNLSIYAVKIVKDEKISTIYIPKHIGPARHVRIQVEGARPLQLAGLQAIKGDMPQPKVAPTQSTTSTETRSGPVTGLALLFANVKERAAAAAAANGGANGTVGNGMGNGTTVSSSSTVSTVGVLLTATAVLTQRPHTTPSTMSLAGNQSSLDECDSDSNSSCSLKYQRIQDTRPATAPKLYTKNMAEHCVDSLMLQTLNGYKQKEEFEERLARAKSAFTEQELPPLTELFQSVAQEAGYLKTMPLEFIKVQTTSIITSFLSLRTRNTALKELLGEGSSLEALTEAIDNVCRMRQTQSGGKPVKTIPADYTQYLEMVTMLRQGKVTLADVSHTFATFINKGRRRTPIESRGLHRPKTATRGDEEVPLMDKDKQKLMHSLQGYLRQRQGFLKRYERKAKRDEGRSLEFVDWAKVHDERREHQEHLRLIAPPPDITPRLPHKACAVCLFHYPGDALVESVTVKSLANLFTRLNLPPDKYATRLEFGMNKFYRIPICVFCYQLFDPDEEDGIAKSRCTRDLIGYTPFLDDRYPDRYSMADPTVRKKYSASSLVKQYCCHTPPRGLCESEVVTA